MGHAKVALEVPLMMCCVTCYVFTLLANLSHCLMVIRCLSWVVGRALSTVALKDIS